MPFEGLIGQIMPFGGNFAPRNWAFCDGQLLAIAQYTALFSIVGTTYGGDGRTTLGLPNLIGRAALHPGTGPQLSNYRLGQRGGSNTATLVEAQLPPHNHSISVVNAAATAPVPAANLAPSNKNIYTAQPANEPMAPQVIGTNMGGVDHENRQAFQVVSFVICLVGLYPSRS